MFHKAGATKESPERLSQGKSFGKIPEKVIVCSSSKKECWGKKIFLLPIDVFECH